MRKISLVVLSLVLFAAAPVLGALPAMRVADPRLVDETEVVAGHLVHFIGLSADVAKLVPKNVALLSIDGGPPHFFEFPAGVNPRVLLATTTDPNQGNGNNPGVHSVTNGDLNISIGGTPQDPTIALAPNITITGNLTLSSATTPTISGGGNGSTSVGLELLTTATPGPQAFLLRAMNAPTGTGAKLLDLQVGSTSEASVDPSGNLSANSVTVTANATAAPAISCVAGTFPCEIQANTGSTVDAVVIDNSGTCTPANSILNVSKAHNGQLQVFCNGNIKVVNGVIIDASSTGSGLTMGSGTALGGTNTIGCVNTGASTCTLILGSTSVPTVGNSVHMAGHIIQDADKELASTCTLNGLGTAQCSITFANAYTGTLHPICPAIEEYVSAVHHVSVSYIGSSGSWTGVTVTSALTADTGVVDVGPCVAQNGS